ncbi:prepilin-type N-terminal cleavage/methylation domain-containing protein [Exiguobacterium sp. SH3S2]|uniref:prepilin-type N-terminal cleavage/methylation domain-containing protein n=1 Tax=unclassified Exiguobacterium TaxID=2644629 RepID=UPI00103B0124|nr:MULTISPECIES: prepilin-type N-terminal cleavage/methylation domain-containing protein [unclassified Exiguobacterium]TCI43347.1 prepilin-type N-terminal cleavage/methylation domain-containing protein [Exiguobacterium sp. SH3S3]TCI59193.1 prepilin-type N-terminal cleavage/methylation domain-containing protein [Exiguobacterium sp. SH3S2]
MARSEKGFTLVEVLVSMVVVSILALAMMNIFTQSLRVTSSDLDRTVANQVAQNTLNTLKRRAAETREPIEVSKLKVNLSNQCDLCAVSINGRDFEVTITSPGNEPVADLVNVEITVASETLLQPINLKGVVTNATLQDKFPETDVPENPGP